MKVNPQKSRALYSSGVKRTKINKLTSIRSCTSLEKYLGFPMLKGRVKKTDFNFILDKLQGRLSAWKNRLLNKAGRITLAKSVLNSIPTYYMQIAWLPQAICDQIDRVSREFIWKGTTDKGIHLVGWNTITKPKKHGGLGIRRAREANTALLGKLVWDIQQKKDKLWVEVIRDNISRRINFFSLTDSMALLIGTQLAKLELSFKAVMNSRLVMVAAQFGTFLGLS